MEHSNNILIVDNVSFSYGKHVIFREIGFEIHENDYVTVLGPNGGGKSTLVKLIIGLLEPESGSIRIRGMAPKNAGGIIGYVPQYMNFDTNFPITVLDTVLTGSLGRSWGFYSKRQRKDAAEALEAVGLSDLGDTSFSEISGGQRQRAMIARALVGQPGLLILDEPTASADAAVEKSFSELLYRLNRKLTIIMVTHDFGFVDKSVSRVLCVNHNVAEHPAEEVDESLIISGYGRGMKSVRHDIHMEET